MLLRLPERRLTPREAMFAATERTPLALAPGRIAGEPLGAYPPGIAVTMPGERISEAAVAYLTGMEEKGATLFGVHGGQVALVAEP